MTALSSDPSTWSRTVMPTGFSLSPPRESAHTRPSRGADWWGRAGHTARPGPTPGKSTVSCWTFSDGEADRHSEVPIGHRNVTTPPAHHPWHLTNNTQGSQHTGRLLNFNRLEAL